MIIGTTFFKSANPSATSGPEAAPSCRNMIADMQEELTALLSTSAFTWLFRNRSITLNAQTNREMQSVKSARRKRKRVTKFNGVRRERNRQGGKQSAARMLI
ncbi:MAG: hypothetical protein AAGE90_05245 [Pseudomonadota bacterium]